MEQLDNNKVDVQEGEINKIKEEEEKINNDKIKKEKIKNLLFVKDKIMRLNKNEYYEIYKIIKNANESFSKNKNGVMFDLLKLQDSTLEKINTFLNYLNDKNNQINNDEFNRYKYSELINKNSD